LRNDREREDYVIKAVEFMTSTKNEWEKNNHRKDNGSYFIKKSLLTNHPKKY